MKIFIMERIATWLLIRDPSFAARRAIPSRRARASTSCRSAIVCDALKIAYVTQGRGQYKDVFLLVQPCAASLEFSDAGWPIVLGLAARAAVAAHAQDPTGPTVPPKPNRARVLARPPGAGHRPYRLQGRMAQSVAARPWAEVTGYALAPPRSPNLWDIVGGAQRFDHR